MNQTKLESLIEACINVGIGFFVSIVANFLIFPIVGVSASGGQILWIGLFMTVISVARSYIVRRWAQKHLTTTKLWIYNFFTKTEKTASGLKLNISDTGRIWVDPNEVIQTEEFKKQLEAVKRLRERN